MLCEIYKYLYFTKQIKYFFVKLKDNISLKNKLYIFLIQQINKKFRKGVPMNETPPLSPKKSIKKVVIKKLNQQPDTLLNIKITPEGQQPIKDVEFVSDKKRVSLIMNDIRRVIIKVLREGIEDTVTIESFDEEHQERIIRQKIVYRNIMSVAEIVEQSKRIPPSKKLTKNQVYHHLPILIDAGIVIKYGTIESGKRNTDYYRRTANAFSLHCYSCEDDNIKNMVKEKLGDLIKRLNPNKMDELSELVFSLEATRDKYTKQAYTIVGGDITTLNACSDFEWLVWILSLADEKLPKIAEKIREIVQTAEEE